MCFLNLAMHTYHITGSWEVKILKILNEYDFKNTFEYPPSKALLK